jgi:hypothetical protein
MKKAAKPAKKAESAKPAKPMAKSTKKAEPKVKLSVSKKSETIEIIAEEVVKSAEAVEEEEEAMESAAAARSSANDAGLAMAAATTEASAGSLKNFRHHPDIENFYRFIYENDLRYEGLEIIDQMMSQRETIKAMRAAKAKAH